MSSILKALQKLEQERTARRGGQVDLARDLARKDGRDEKQRAWLVPAGMGGVAVVAVLATYAFMGGVSSHRPAAVAPASPLPVQRPLPAEEKAGTTPESMGEPVTKPAPAYGPNLAGKGGRPSPSPVPATEQQATPVPRPAPSAAPYQKSPAATPPAPAPATPLLSVSGIAWQKDSTARLAMVNGLSVTEGAMVEGARVEEILPDRVRFSFDRRDFDVPLGKSSKEK